ncbi:MAG: hypothetical protein WCK35_28265, partial [Chloroflexota bacterium]
EATRIQKKKPEGTAKLADNQAFCMRCRKAVTLVNPFVESGRGKLLLIKGICPICGSKINRGGRKND